MTLKHTITAAALAALSRRLCAGAAWVEGHLDLLVLREADIFAVGTASGNES
jgi:hypothetical protein